MAQPAFIQKTLFMKPEVSKIFDDLEAWLDYCRFNLVAFNPGDLYRSQDHRNFQRWSNGGEQRRPRTEYKGNNPRPYNQR